MFMQVILALFLGYFLQRIIIGYLFPKKLPNNVENIVKTNREKFQNEEEAHVRYRFTESRLKKVLPNPEDEFDFVFVGSGPASMACAASLARCGNKCAVFEQGDQLGGGAHVFSEQNYEFETGIHYIGKGGDLDGLADFLTCGGLTWSDIGADIGTGYDNLMKLFKSRFPSTNDHKRIEKFMSHVKVVMSKSYDKSGGFFFILKVPNFIPTRLRLFLQQLFCNPFYKYTQMTLIDLLEDCDVDPKSELAAVLLGQYGDAGSRPDKCSAMMHLGVMAHYINGARYPVGGSSAIPRKMNTVIRAAGGISFVQARVESFLFDDAASKPTCVGVKVNGVNVKSRCVISGIGVSRTYKLLIPQIPLQANEAIRDIESCTENSVSFMFLFLGLDISDQPENERDNRSHNTWIYPCTDYTQMEKDIENAKPFEVPLPMFVASGSAKDSTWDQTHDPNKKTVVVIAQCPWHWVAEWSKLNKKEREKDIGYQNFKEKVKETLMPGFRRVFPKLEKYIRFSSVGTPITTNDYLGAENGECYGLAATPGRCGSLSPHTPVKNLFLTGQDIIALGLPSALSSGYLTANVVMGYDSWENAILQRDIMFDMSVAPLFT